MRKILYEVLEKTSKLKTYENAEKIAEIIRKEATNPELLKDALEDAHHGLGLVISHLVHTSEACFPNGNEELSLVVDIIGDVEEFLWKLVEKLG